jgi:hypothetical protein
MQFLDRSGKHADCITLHSPHELNEAERVSTMLEFLGLRRRHQAIVLRGRHNRNPRPTVVSDADRREFAAVIKSLPATYLEIFQGQPYVSFPWATLLQPPGSPAHTPQQ